MLRVRLARPILVLARAIPMVRMNRPIGPFCRAKTCSTAERTADLRALAGAVRHGIGLPLGFLRWICERSKAAEEEFLVGPAATGGVGPDVAGGVVRVEEPGEQCPIVAGGVGDCPAAEQAIGGGRRRCGSCSRRPARRDDVGQALFAGLGLGVLAPSRDVERSWTADERTAPKIKSREEVRIPRNADPCALPDFDRVVVIVCQPTRTFAAKIEHRADDQPATLQSAFLVLAPNRASDRYRDLAA